MLPTRYPATTHNNDRHMVHLQHNESCTSDRSESFDRCHSLPFQAPTVKIYEKNPLPLSTVESLNLKLFLDKP
jgi:hypothetical protein